MRVGRILGAVLLVLVATAVGTYVAGERVEVVRLQTVDADGTPYTTKLWVVDHDGVPWVRVANPKRRWFARLAVHPRAELHRRGEIRTVEARPQDTPEVRAIIDRRFREKYGLVDWWYGLLLRRHAIPVRLDPAPADVEEALSLRWSAANRKLSDHKAALILEDGPHRFEMRGGWVCTVGAVDRFEGVEQRTTTCEKAAEQISFSTGCGAGSPGETTRIWIGDPRVEPFDLIEVYCDAGAVE